MNKPIRFKMIKVLIALTVLPIFAFADFAGNSAGGGGAGITRKGQYITFGSAGLRLKLGGALRRDQLPALEKLVEALTSPLVSSITMVKVIDAIMPSSSRKYFPIEDAQLDEAKRAELMKVYQQMTNAQYDPNDVVLFGITVGNETYLLPKFFKIRSIEKPLEVAEAEEAAVLFHESLWVLNPKWALTPELYYEKVVEGEMLIQAHIQNKNVNKKFDLPLFSYIADVTGKPMSVAIAALKYDYEMLSKECFGKRSGHEVESDFHRVFGNSNDDSSICAIAIYLSQIFHQATFHELVYKSKNQRAALTYDLLEKIRQHPSVLFLRALYEIREHLNLEFTVRSSIEKMYFSMRMNGSKNDFNLETQNAISQDGDCIKFVYFDGDKHQNAYLCAKQK